MWTADAEAEWSRDWASSEVYKRLWPQAVRWTMAAPSTPGIQVALHGTGRGDDPGGSFDAPGQYRNHLQTVAEVAFPDGTGQRVPVPQTAPGRYEGAFALDRPGVYFVQLTQTDPGNGRLVARQTTGFALPHLPEYAVNPANRVLLERLAADTGGLLRDPAGAWARPSRFGWRPQPLWPELLAGARRSSWPTSPCAACASPGAIWASCAVPALPAVPSAAARRRAQTGPSLRPALLHPARRPGPAPPPLAPLLPHPTGAHPLRTGYNEPDLVERRPSFARRWWLPLTLAAAGLVLLGAKLSVRSVATGQAIVPIAGAPALGPANTPTATPPRGAGVLRGAGAGPGPGSRCRGRGGGAGPLQRGGRAAGDRDLG